MIRENFYSIDCGAHVSRGGRRALQLLAARDLGRSICFGGGGGGSSSTSSTSTSADTTTNTTNIDKRSVVDSGSVGVSSDQSTVYVTATDNNAVKNALDFATGAGNAAIDLSKTSSDQAYKGLVELLGLARDVVKVEAATSGQISAAYSTASDSANGTRTITQTIAYAGLAVVGFIAFKHFSKA